MLGNFESSHWNLLAIIAWVRWRDPEIVGLANSDEVAIRRLVRELMKWPSDELPDLKALEQGELIPEPTVKQAATASYEQHTACSEIENAGGRGALIGYDNQPNRGFALLSVTDWLDIKISKYFPHEGQGGTLPGDISYFDTVGRPRVVNVPRLGRDDLKFERNSVLLEWRARHKIVPDRASNVATPRGPRPATRERVKNEMLGRLRNGTITPQQLTICKQEALASEYNVSRETSVKARATALSEFCADETPTNNGTSQLATENTDG